MFIAAELHGKPVGLASGVVHNGEKECVHIYQMWVTPNARGHGAGRALLNSILSWAISTGVNAVELGVTTTNEAAYSLYLSIGFTPWGHLEPLRQGSSLSIQPMLLHLDEYLA